MCLYVHRWGKLAQYVCMDCSGRGPNICPSPPLLHMPLMEPFVLPEERVPPASCPVWKALGQLCLISLRGQWRFEPEPWMKMHSSGLEKSHGDHGRPGQSLVNGISMNSWTFPLSLMRHRVNARKENLAVKGENTPSHSILARLIPHQCRTS